MNETRLKKSPQELVNLLNQTRPPPSLVPDLVEIARAPEAARGLPGASLCLRSRLRF